MRSPLEAMIDRACGYDPANPPPVRKLKSSLRTIILHCPNCQKERLSLREKTDPKGTSVVEVACPECINGEEFVPISYFDKDGKEIAA